MDLLDQQPFSSIFKLIILVFLVRFLLLKIKQLSAGNTWMENLYEILSLLMGAVIIVYVYDKEPSFFLSILAEVADVVIGWVKKALPFFKNELS